MNLELAHTARLHRPVSTAIKHPDVHVLVVDDEPLISRMIGDYLREYDMRVTTLTDGSEVADLVEREAIDLVILDVKLPGEDGMQVARRLRENWDLPIVMLTGRKDEADRVMALELGADDYLTKPFSPRELLARIRALLRRSKTRETMSGSVAKVRAYRFAGWELNVRLRRLISPTGISLPCTNGEFHMLTAFLSAPQRVLSRQQLLDLSRMYNDEVYDRTIDVQIGRLRQKLQRMAADQPLIRTERGAGYIFTAAVEVLR